MIFKIRSFHRTNTRICHNTKRMYIFEKIYQKIKNSQKFKGYDILNLRSANDNKYFA